MGRLNIIHVKLHWLITGTGEMLLPETITDKAAADKDSKDMERNPVADFITDLLQAITKANETPLKEDIEQLQHQL